MFSNEYSSFLISGKDQCFENGLSVKIINYNIINN